MALSERDRAILDFERSWWIAPIRKETAIRDRFGLSASRYRELLVALIDSEDAANFDPLLVRRLRRARDQRRKARFGGPADRGRRAR